MKTYSQETQAQAADELEALPEGAVLPVFIADYAVLRAQLRALWQGTEAVVSRFRGSFPGGDA